MAKKRNDFVVVIKNQTAWQKIPYREMHVDNNLIVCQKRLFPNGQNKRLLYIGFGEGHNLEYLAQQGFKCSGTEIAKNQLTYTRRRFQKAGLRANLHLINSDILPFAEDFFDVVIAWQSLYYNSPETLKIALAEIKRVLKPGGQFLSSMVSPKQKLLCYKKIAPWTYQPSPITKQERCILTCLQTKQQIRSFYKPFKNIKIGYYRSELFRSPNFHWVIYGEKKT